jgi:carboxylate-amine ligase
VSELAGGTTMGVEEEFLLVDPVTGTTVPRAAQVLARASRRPPHSPGAQFHAELVATQVEAVTGVCTTLSSLRRQLTGNRRRLADAAAAEGTRLLSSGTPVRPCADPPFTDGDRFASIAERYAALVTGYQSSGCHVHIGVADRETAVAVANHLRPWLPTLLTLSVNSPIDRGTDTGHASWRMVGQLRFPGAGAPPWFPSAAAYDRQIDRLVDSGVLTDHKVTFWLARPSPHLPTVEVRAADATATVEEAVHQAALARALVRRALADLEKGREAPRIDHQTCAGALWSAARYGLDGPGVHPIEGRRVPALRMVGELLERVRPALEDTGDLTEVGALLTGLYRGGTGAVRQRRAAALGGSALVRMLIRQTVGEPLAETVHTVPAG